MEQAPWKGGKLSLAEMDRDPGVTAYKCQMRRWLSLRGLAWAGKITGSNLILSFYGWNGEQRIERTVLGVGGQVGVKAYTEAGYRNRS